MSQGSRLMQLFERNSSSVRLPLANASGSNRDDEVVIPMHIDAHRDPCLESGLSGPIIESVAVDGAFPCRFAVGVRSLTPTYEGARHPHVRNSLYETTE